MLVRYRGGSKGHKVPKRYHVLKGTVEKKNPKTLRYRIRYTDPVTGMRTVSWFSVADITSLTRRAEQRRQKEHGHGKKSHCQKFYIELTHQDAISYFESSNMAIQYDPTPDGNCQFAAVADQLQAIGVFSGQRSRCVEK